MHYILVLLTFFMLTAPLTASAQRYDNRTLMSRIDQLEHDIRGLRSSSRRGGNETYTIESNDAGAARLQVSLAEFEERLRALRGMIEENQYRTQTLENRLQAMQEDVDFRLRALEGTGGPAPTSNRPPLTSPEPFTIDGYAPPESTADTTASYAPTPNRPQGVLAPQPAAGDTNFANPREHYNYAFKLLNQTRYDEAATFFRSFTQQYQKDPLIGNAFYWLGESHYVRGDYIKAADAFRQGFETLPKGPKASDNLLKLAMSLSAVDRTKESCVVLRQLIKKFGDNSVSVRNKAKEEMGRLGC